MADKPFLTDIKTLQQARQHIEQGAVTPGYRADRPTVLRLLNEALATEIVCILRYKRHYFMAAGINAQSVAGFCRPPRSRCTPIRLRSGLSSSVVSPIFLLGLLTRSHAEYVEGDSLIDMIKEDLVAERIAIDSYREMIHYLGNDDSTTRRMMEGILAMEEEHADDLVSLLEELGTSWGVPSCCWRAMSPEAALCQSAVIQDRRGTLRDPWAVSP